MINIVGHKYIFLTISGLLVLAALVSIFVFGFKQGIDFIGGTLWQVRLEKLPTADQVQETLTKEFKLSDLTIFEEPSTQSLLLRLPELTEAFHQQYLEVLKKNFGKVEELSYETIGPSIGAELRNKAVYAFLGVLLTISLYIAFAFRKVSRPISSWKYGLITLVTLFHDALIPLGVVAYLGATQGIEMNTNLVVAVLVIIGFSVHDTIVVFDRIRENLKLEKNYNFDFAHLVNKSVNETIARSINTSLTLALVLLALLVFGSANLTYFVLTILIGLMVGAYSSIFIASPLLVLWSKKAGVDDKK